MKKILISILPVLLIFSGLFPVVALAGTPPSTYDTVEIYTEPIKAYPSGGLLKSGATVRLATDVPGATIRYTTGTAVPTNKSTIYSSPIQITSATTINARLFDAADNLITVHPVTGVPVTVDKFVYLQPVPATTPLVSIDMPMKTYAAGEFITVNVNLERNPGLATFSMELEFDKTYLKPLSIAPGSWFANGMLDSNLDPLSGYSADDLEYITAFWSNRENINNSGTLFTVVFEVRTVPYSAGVSAYEAGFNIVIDRAAKQDATNVFLQSINSPVYAVPFVVGDTNGDLTFDIMDLLLLSQYLAQWNISITELNLWASDVYFDGVIDGKDAVLMAQCIALWGSSPGNQANMGRY